MGSFQARATVCLLRIESGFLAEKEGRVFLVQPSPGMSEDTTKWSVSAPTIRDASGKYMAWSPEEKGAHVVLQEDRGQNTRWAFIMLDRISPQRREVEVCSGKKTFLVGDQGFTFRVQVAEGPFKGWYIGVEEMTPEEVERNKKEAIWRPLKLVRGPKAAAVFTFVSERYAIGG
jgi:hypothetical protein